MTVFRQPSLLLARVAQAIFAKRGEEWWKTAFFDQNWNLLDSYLKPLLVWVFAQRFGRTGCCCFSGFWAKKKFLHNDLEEQGWLFIFVERA
jgi:hypothetical protein